ncbi:MAG TPA: cytochrome P450 [Thermomicrobiaceae bacterium]|nr:cytochrome P450 [Thermomicrobiaceae bacterium]
MPGEYDLFSRRARRDPYPGYRRIREEAPVYWDGRKWTLTRYDDVLAALSDPRWSVEQGGFAPAPGDGEGDDHDALNRTLRDMMLLADPPRHTRLRGLVAQAFSARAIRRMAEEIARQVDEMLVEVKPRGRMDVIADLGNPLPGRVIAAMLGVPASDQEQLKRWATGIAFALDSTGSRDAEERRRQGRQVVVELAAYLREIIAARRRAPRDDLITALVQARDRDDRLTEDEVVSTVILLLFAGNETTTNLIGNGVLTLLRHPDALARLRADPGLLRTAVEEVLRFESPVQYTSRVALAPTAVGGKRIEPGQTGVFVVGAANRDPAQFADPDTFDVARAPNHHLGFGHGTHFCLGAPLARLQGQLAIGAVARLAGLEPTGGEVEWRETAGFRGLTALPIAFEAR